MGEVYAANSIRLSARDVLGLESYLPCTQVDDIPYGVSRRKSHTLTVVSSRSGPTSVQLVEFGGMRGGERFASTAVLQLGKSLSLTVFITVVPS